MCALLGTLHHQGLQPGDVSGRISCQEKSGSSHHRSLYWADIMTGSLPQKMGLPAHQRREERPFQMSEEKHIISPPWRHIALSLDIKSFFQGVALASWYYDLQGEQNAN